MLTYAIIFGALAALPSPAARFLVRYLVRRSRILKALAYVPVAVAVALLTLLAFITNDTILEWLRVTKPREFLKSAQCTLGADGSFTASVAIFNVTSEPLVLNPEAVGVTVWAINANGTAVEGRSMPNRIVRGSSGNDLPYYVIAPGDGAWLELHGTHPDVGRDFVSDNPGIQEFSCSVTAGLLSVGSSQTVEGPLAVDRP